MLNKEHIWKQLGTYEQMMLEHSYRLTGTLRVYVACLYRLTSDKSSFGKKHGTYKDFYSMLYCCGILQSSNDVWGNCFRLLFRASITDGDYLFYVILSCSYFVLTMATFILQKEEPFTFLSQEAQESIPIENPLQKKEKSECHWFSSCQIESPSRIYRE